MKECEYWNLSLFNPESLIEVCEFMEIDRIKLDLKLFYLYGRVKPYDTV